MRSRIVGVAVIGAFWNGPAAAQLPDARESLAGLGGVQVVVEYRQPGAEHFGLTKDILTTDIEGRLRQAEIRVFSDAEATSSVMFLPRFYVFVGTVPGSGPLTNLYILGLRAELHQRLLSPITKQMVASITWQKEATGYTGADHLREDVPRSVAEVHGRIHHRLSRGEPSQASVAGPLGPASCQSHSQAVGPGPCQGETRCFFTTSDDATTAFLLEAPSGRRAVAGGVVGALLGNKAHAALVLLAVALASALVLLVVLLIAAWGWEA